ncbi:MAG TPA: hypothetical protein VLB46_03575 [Pyrinomonadaceae bacterium]|nr:hypothetical protein [Pyrinomonadaceae bacterium]
MCPRVGLRASLRIALPFASILASAMGQGRGARTPPPRPGKPEGTFPISWILSLSGRNGLDCRKVKL